MTCRITVNGAPRDAQAGSVRELVTELGLAPETLLIEHNSTALHRSEWESTPLADGDRLEILRVSAGG
jgi:sulfur carrier protein